MLRKVKWLMDGKRQTDRFGSWERVEEGQVSDWPVDQLHRIKEGVHFEYFEEPEDEPSEEAPVPLELVENAPDGTPATAGDESSENASSEASGESSDEPKADEPKADEPKAPKKRGRRKIAKKE